MVEPVTNTFSPLCIFELKVVFRYHFLSHFLAELNEICCGPLLNSILKTYRSKFLKTWICFHPKKSKMSNFGGFFKQKMIKHLIFNKTKNASVRFFSYMSSMCVQLFTAFEEGFWSYMYLGECPKIEYGHHFHGNKPREKYFFGFFLHIFSYWS